MRSLYEAHRDEHRADLPADVRALDTLLLAALAVAERSPVPGHFKAPSTRQLAALALALVPFGGEG